MDFWGTVWSSVVALLVVALVTAVAASIWAYVRARLSRRPEFELRRDFDGEWSLKRTAQRPAFEIHHWVSERDSSFIDGNNDIRLFTPDLRRGQTCGVDPLDGKQGTRFSWIDQGRMVSQYIKIRDQEEGTFPVQIDPLMSEKRRRRWYWPFS